MTEDQFRTRFTWNTDPVTACWTNIEGERLRCSDPKYLPLAGLRRNEGAPVLKNGDSGFSQRIPRLAYETFLGPCEKTPRQTCGNWLCFNPDHLKPVGRTATICKCEKCGQMKPREEMDQPNLKRRHYSCKIHIQKEEQRKRETDARREDEHRKREERKEIRIASLNSPERKRILEERRIKENKKRVAYMKEKYRNDPAFYALVCCRRRVSNLIKSKGIIAPYRTLELVGCSAEELMHHIESQFRQGMSWNNKGKWHIDHIRPCASFDLTDPAQQKECFHWSNLRPIWARRNWKKHDHWDGQLDMTHALLQTTA